MRVSFREVLGRDEMTKPLHCGDPGAPCPLPSLTQESVTQHRGPLHSADRTDQNSSGRWRALGAALGHSRGEGRWHH